ncbi:enoyl-CoA hydratase-related protein [Egicoccus halophilus]|uniref:Methylglutaconyl-CoA hydratase n=1 Tax=Egicoccus halophilus TaxID=1670830 RepID=A0A8J3ET87_9ACTN|nr:enoyl-CoA hydratase-related protein [Egicoccus halophilus]GGI05114.1 methylglutaconyl-CoA hydratase [Egicoccus halophilus]
MSDALLIDRDERGVVTLTLNRPEVRNAFDPTLMGAITDAATRLADDPDVRVLVLTGAGTVFSGGADLSWMSSVMDYSFEESVADSRNFEAMLRAVDEFPAPTVARVNGHAMGGAAGLLGCVDVAVAVRGAKLAFTEVRVGIAPSMISAYVQPRIGARHARRYFLSGEPFDADRALHLGLVSEVCEPDDLDATVETVVTNLLAGAPEAQRATKQLIRDIDRLDRNGSQQLRLELIARLRAAEEGQEGMQAFFDKRKASWIPSADA